MNKKTKRQIQLDTMTNEKMDKKTQAIMDKMTKWQVDKNTNGQNGRKDEWTQVQSRQNDKRTQ